MSITMKTTCSFLAAILSLTIRIQAAPPQVARSSRDMVVSVSPPATDVGVQILGQGGTAVDAAVAVGLALQVTWPEAGNIGGGGFMLVHEAAGKVPVFLDYRETAPAAATRRMYGKSETTHHCRSVGVPGTLRGFQLAHQRYGRLPWPALVAPAVQLAADGFTVDEGLARSLNSGLSKRSHSLAEFHRVYSPPDGKKWKSGDILKQPDLAASLTLIAESGADAFYAGRLGTHFLDEMQRGEGLITQADLAAYQAKVREPVHINFNGFDIYAPSLPSSGGICLKEMFQVWEQSPVRQLDRWSKDSVHYRAEMMRRVFLDRARYLGDSDFVSIPAELTTPEHAAKLAASIRLDVATPSRELAPDLLSDAESQSTTHYSIVDSNGMGVSNTYTLEESFGSGIVVRGAGFLLNNEMGDFNWFPGEHTETWRIGTAPNEIRPGKRMLSSMTPVIVQQKGQLMLVTGSPGGRTIINTVFCVLLNILEFGLSLPDAVAAPRIHHQWMPDKLNCERNLMNEHSGLVTELRGLGHDVKFSGHQGDVHSVIRLVPSGDLLGVADTRISGSASGH